MREYLNKLIKKEEEMLDTIYSGNISKIKAESSRIAYGASSGDKSFSNLFRASVKIFKA